MNASHRYPGHAAPAALWTLLLALSQPAGAAGASVEGEQSGVRWDKVLDGSFQVMAADGGHIYAGGGAGLFRSDDDGKTWKPIHPPADDERAGTGAPKVLELAAAGQTVFAATASALFRSSDAGASWQVSLALPEVILALDATSDGSFAASTTDGVYVFIAGMPPRLACEGVSAAERVESLALFPERVLLHAESGRVFAFDYSDTNCRDVGPSMGNYFRVDGGVIRSSNPATFSVDGRRWDAVQPPQMEAALQGAARWGDASFVITSSFSVEAFRGERRERLADFIGAGGGPEAARALAVKDGKLFVATLAGVFRRALPDWLVEGATSVDVVEKLKGGCDAKNGEDCLALGLAQARRGRKQEAASAFQASCIAGNVEGCVRWAPSASSDAKEALDASKRLLPKACRAADSQACGALYVLERRVDKHPPESKRLLELGRKGCSARNPSLAACRGVTNSLFGLNQKKEAIVLHDRACTAGDDKACTSVMGPRPWKASDEDSGDEAELRARALEEDRWLDRTCRQGVGAACDALVSIERERQVWAGMRDVALGLAMRRCVFSTQACIYALARLTDEQATEKADDADLLSFARRACMRGKSGCDRARLYLPAALAESAVPQPAATPAVSPGAGTGATAPPSPSVAPGGAPISPAPTVEQGWAVGEALEVEWKGRWYPATIRSRDGDRYRIHYTGYADSWDEWVTAPRMRRKGQAVPSPTSAPVVAQTWLVGDTLEVEWNGAWYPATILRGDGDRYLIHYTGYGSNWDEWVTPGRMRRKAR